MVYIYGDKKNIYFTVSLSENHTIRESRCDRENASRDRMAIFFGNSVRVIEQRFDISFRKVLELQK